ncbi:glycoside hydrolase family 3 protein [Salinactinospora qingdaonensis]|uniref:beta-N-acetylhexosaminidase n=1 Tax=Salinactinospora qingdaonensis TaxID=702744 RepID=A0ABP7FGL4_9ACTN
MFPRGLFAVIAAGTLLSSAACSSGEGTPPNPSPTTSPSSDSSSAAQAAAELLAEMSRAEKIGQLFVPMAQGTTAEANADLIADYHPGGLIYFPDSLVDTAQIADMSNGLQELAAAGGAGVPLLLGIDQEQGMVARLPVGAHFPDAMAVGATRDPDAAASLAATTAQELSALGITLDYAPVADVNVDPANPVIGIRSFGAEPELVADMVTAETEAFAENGVASAVKHFPGHGDTSVDSHTGLPEVDVSRQEWEEVHLPPFRRAVDAGADMIMTAHVVVPALDDSGEPATLSPEILDGVLRDELGYDGVVTTDALNMAGVRQRYDDGEIAVRAVLAGADQLLMPPDLPAAHAAVTTAVEEGRISLERLDASVRRILELKLRHGLDDAEPADPDRAAQTVGGAEHRAAAREVAEASVTLLRNSEEALPLEPGAAVSVQGSGKAAIGGELAKLGMEVVAAPAQADVAVVGTSNARGDAEQRALVRNAGREGVPVVVVAQGTPYDITDLPDIDAYVATYSAVEVSRRAAARVLAGEVSPTGRLPVSIPGTDLEFGDGQGYPG